MSGGRIRSVRLKAGYVADSLTNAITGQGTRNDPRSYSAYAPRLLSEYDIAAAYQGSGMMAKVIDIPALDVVREWREWQADKAQIALLEAEERRLDLRSKVRRAEIYRGLGGGAFILGLPGDPATPAPATIGRNGIAFIHVVTRWQLTIGNEVDDHMDPRFGGPEFFRLSTSRGTQFIHPSRVICFKGDPVPPILGQTWDDRFWGRSKVHRVLDAVQNVDTAQGAFAGLIAKARNVIIGIPGLMETVADPAGEALLQKRLAAMVLGESLYNATLRDAGDGTSGAGETIDHRQVTWSGIPEIMMAFATFLSAVSDIPATRLMGKSPDGQNATGASDTANWNRMVKARQTLDLGPCLDQLDRYLYQSSGVGTNADGAIWYQWAPLDTPTEKELADTFKTTMDAVEKVQATGSVPEEAFAKALQNTLVEGGWMPGLEAALAEIPEAERYGLHSEPDPNEPDPSALAISNPGNNGKEVDPTSPTTRDAGGDRVPARAANGAAAWLSDATPRPLYVQRKLLNAADLVAWAKDNGFSTTLPASDMHVTVLYSRSAVDPMKMGRDWRENERGEITVRPGGPRVIEKLGESAVVLRFACPDLDWRHRDMIEAGGSHDYPEYQPHVTISYAVPEGVDLEAIKPFNGELRFGSEIFETLDLEWKSKITEA